MIKSKIKEFIKDHESAIKDLEKRLDAGGDENIIFALIALHQSVLGELVLLLTLTDVK